MTTFAGSQASASILAPAVRRLNALTALDVNAAQALRGALARARAYHPPVELLVEGQRITETLLLLDGWAARVRNLADGRRAIMNFLLPGDLIGNCDHDHPIAASTVVALTRVAVCPAPPRGQSPALDRAYKLSRATEEAYLLAQITRLSRLNAHDRLADLLLELLERLGAAGLAPNGRYDFPMTQEIVGDALGLSTVHVNRTLQQVRRDSGIAWSGRRVHIAEPDVLRQAIGREAVRVADSRPSAVA